MKKVVLRAPVFSASGYGTHSRQIARWLLSKPDIDLIVHPVNWGMTHWYMDAAAFGGLIGELHKRSRDEKGPFDASFQVQLPNEWSKDLAAINVGITAAVETLTCNPSWVKNCEAMNAVVVPSTFSKAVIERSGEIDRTKIRVIHESFPDALLHASKKLDINVGSKFNFLTVGQMTSRTPECDRKNTFNTIKWFCEAFAGNRDVGLIIKTNNGRDTKIDRKVTIDTLKQVLAHVRKGDLPRVHLLHGCMSDDEMASLYKHDSVKAFVTFSRGEGFGLPMLEAAASGLPIIAPNWSGYLDFLSLGKFIKVDFELTEISKSRVDGTIFMEHAKWAEPDEHDAKKKLLKFYEKPSIPKLWADDLAPAIKEKFSFAAVSKQWDSLWKDELGG